MANKYKDIMTDNGKRSLSGGTARWHETVLLNTERNPFDVVKTQMYVVQHGCY
jgi:hypothetical protein